jgi:hypothetical protein
MLMNSIKSERGHIENCFHEFHCATGSNFYASARILSSEHLYRKFALASSNAIRCIFKNAVVDYDLLEYSGG